MPDRIVSSPACWRGEHDGVGLLDHAVHRARDERPRVVRHVAVDDAAGVDDHRLPCADLALRRARVRPRGVRPGGDDALEGDLVGPFLVEELLDPPGDVTFTCGR